MTVGQGSIGRETDLTAQMQRAAQASPGDVEAADRLAVEIGRRLGLMEVAVAASLHRIEADSLPKLLGG